MITANNNSGNSTQFQSGPPPEKPATDPLEHERPEIDEIEENEPVEQPEIDQLERPQPDIDEIDQGDVEPEINQ